MRYINKHTNCHSEIIINNLTEQEAYEIEKNTISEYLQKGYKLTNLDEGGRPGGRSPGPANGMYGKTHTYEAIQKIIAANIGKFGSKNSNSKICDIYDINWNFIQSFNSISEAINDFFIPKLHFTSSTIRTYIGRYELNQIDNVCGYKLKIYRRDNHENTVPSLDNEEGLTTNENIT